MKYSIDWLLENLNLGQAFKYLFFWGHQPSRTGQIISSCLSQWYEAPFTLDNQTYKTAEHWMMAQKALLFEDHNTHQRIQLARTPGETKALGREVQNFNEAIWNEKRIEFVLRGNLEKFSQNPALKEFLINTKDRILVEASPVDHIWGIGLASDDPNAHDPERWQGQNLLGFVLMEVRDQLNNRS